MSTDETRIQSECDKGYGIQDALSRHPLVLAAPIPDAILRHRRKHSWAQKAIVLASVLIIVFELMPLGIGVWRAASHGTLWVSHCDLEITFVVMDADTGDPVSGAAVRVVHAELARDRENLPSFTTDTNGTAIHWCRGVTCSGSSNTVMPWRNTFGAQLPSWMVQAVAPNYGEGEIQELRGKPNWVRHKNGGHAAVTIPLALRRLPAP